MTENDRAAAAIMAGDLLNELFDLSCELGEISSNAHRLEDRADELKYEALDLCEKLKFTHEEEEGEE